MAENAEQESLGTTRAQDLDSKPPYSAKSIPKIVRTFEGALKIFRFCARPNLQCSVGASIGLFSIMCTWIAVRFPVWLLPYSHHPSLQSRNLVEIAVLADPTTQLFCLLFILGSALALISPLGGIPQSVGLLGFVLSYHYYLTAYQWSSWSGLFPHSSLGLGYYLGLASMVIVITSAGGAIRSANNGRPARVLSRFAALSPSSLR